MRDIVAATWIRALAFTPGLWLRLRRLPQPFGPRERMQRVGTLVAFALPLAATFVTCGLATVRDARRGNLYVTSDRTVVVSIETREQGRSKFSLLLACMAVALALAVTTVPAALVGYFVWATTHSAEATVGLAGVFILGAFGAPIFRYSSLAVHQPLTLFRTGDLAATGFARHPTQAPVTPSIVTLDAWLPAGTRMHGVAFESLLPTYLSLASRRGHGLHRRRVGERWRIGGKDLREDLHEIRV